MTWLAGAVALLLLGSGGLAPVSESQGSAPLHSAPVQSAPVQQGGPSIHLSIQNWGADVDLSTPGVTAWAHLGVNGPITRVTVRIDPGEDGLHGYYGRLTAPDAFGGPQISYCGDEHHRIESFVICDFYVLMTRGVNHLTFDLQSASFDGILSQQGLVMGASLSMTPVVEVRRADGSWQSVSASGEIELPGAQISAVRYRILNTGDIPFRAPGACQEGGTVWPYQQLLCTLRTPRPVFALAGSYEVPIRLEDPVGGGLSYLLEARVGVPGLSFPVTQRP